MSQEEIRQALGRAQLFKESLLRELVSFPERKSSDTDRDFAHAYARRILVDTPQVQILLLSWSEGQWAEVHEHDVACGFTVLQGQALETHFEKIGAGYARATGTHTHDLGSLLVTGAGYCHQLGAAPGSRLVTVHVYTPALRSRPLQVVA